MRLLLGAENQLVHKHTHIHSHTAVHMCELCLFILACLSVHTVHRTQHMRHARRFGQNVVDSSCVAALFEQREHSTPIFSARTHRDTSTYTHETTDTAATNTERVRVRVSLTRSVFCRTLPDQHASIHLHVADNIIKCIRKFDTTLFNPIFKSFCSCEPLFLRNYPSIIRLSATMLANRGLWFAGSQHRSAL